MRESHRRYLLPPTVLGLHSLLLLPILIPYRPDSSPYPESSLQFALNSARYAFPLTIVAFAIVRLFRGLIHSRCGNNIAWSLRFFFGVVEEVVRWGLVRFLAQLEGGGYGYGAKKPDSPRHGPFRIVPGTMSVEVEPGIWEGVYIMGWMWSIFDCMYIWWSLKPHSSLLPNAIPREDQNEDGHDFIVNSRPQSYHSWRKEHAKKKSADSTIRTIRGLSKKPDYFHVNPDEVSPREYRDRCTSIDENTLIQQQSLFGKFEDRASSPELSRRSIREEDNDAGDEETSATDNDNDALDSPLTPTKYRPAYHAAVPAQLPRPTTSEEDDEQEESTPTQQKHNARFLMPGSVTSDSDYFGRREPSWTFSNPISPKRQVPEPSRRLSVLVSDSETESPISGSQTPLLSSSIPLDQEQTFLLDQPPLSTYGSTQPRIVSDELPPPPEMQITTSRPYMISHPSYLSITTGDEAEDESDTQAKAGSLGRVYPSHPGFSSSYIHHHFPSPGVPYSTTSKSSPPNTSLRLLRPKLATSQSLPLRKGRTKRPRSFPGAVPYEISSLQTPLDSKFTYIKRVNGVNISSITYVLVFLWAINISFQHIGYGLWYVWFPTLVFEAKIQWWSIVFFVGISFSKGVYAAQMEGGWVTA
ncbi:hypothetical protein TWF694_008630 [Orbilia ellipsospora]